MTDSRPSKRRGVAGRGGLTPGSTLSTPPVILMLFWPGGRDVAAADL